MSKGCDHVCLKAIETRLKIKNVSWKLEIGWDEVHYNAYESLKLFI